MKMLIKYLCKKSFNDVFSILNKNKIWKNNSIFWMNRNYHMLNSYKSENNSNYLFRYDKRNMFIQTATTPNPQSLKFLPGQAVLDEKYTTGVDFTPESKNLKRSALARELLQIQGIKRIFFGKDFISVTKDEQEDWDILKTLIFGTIMDFYGSGRPIITDENQVTDTTILEDDSDVVAMIKELLEDRIRPAVQEDGGDIFYCGFDENTGIVKLQLAGSCAGCPSSSVTLKVGVENMLKHYIPEVTGIEEVEQETELKAVNENEFKKLEEKLRQAGVPTNS